MGKIVIVSEKADEMLEKLECVKTCINEIINCVNTAKSNPDEDWDEEYRINRKRYGKPGYMHPITSKHRYDDDDEDDDEYRYREKYNRSRY